MKTYKKYTIFQSYKVVALKLSLPCPFECKNSKGRGTHNFWATTLKLWKNEYFLRVFKSYYYHFFIFLLDSDLEKTLLSQTSIAWGVLALIYFKTTSFPTTLCKLRTSKKAKRTHHNANTRKTLSFALWYFSASFLFAAMIVQNSNFTLIEFQMH